MLGAVIFFLSRRRKRTSRSRINAVDPFQKAELEGKGTPKQVGDISEVEGTETRRPEIDGGDVVEVEGENKHAHLQELGVRLPVEMDDG